MNFIKIILLIPFLVAKSPRIIRLLWAKYKPEDEMQISDFNNEFIEHESCKYHEIIGADGECVRIRPPITTSTVRY